MTMREDVSLASASDLRRAFDEGFSEPPKDAGGDQEALLAFLSGGVAAAVRIAEIGGLFAGRTTVRLPSRVLEFLGVAALRRDVVPVFSLRALLGRAEGQDLSRWLFVARGAPVAFAFEEFQGYLRVPSTSILPLREGRDRAPVPATVRLGGETRSLVSVPALLGTLEDRIRGTGLSKEE